MLAHRFIEPPIATCNHKRGNGLGCNVGAPLNTLGERHDEFFGNRRAAATSSSVNSVSANDSAAEIRRFSESSRPLSTYAPPSVR